MESSSRSRGFNVFLNVVEQKFPEEMSTIMAERFEAIKLIYLLYIAVF